MRYLFSYLYERLYDKWDNPLKFSIADRFSHCQQGMAYKPFPVSRKLLMFQMAVNSFMNSCKQKMFANGGHKGQ